QPNQREGRRTIRGEELTSRLRWRPVAERRPDRSEHSLQRPSRPPHPGLRGNMGRLPPANKAIESLIRFDSVRPGDAVRKQWMTVLAIVALLAGGTVWLIHAGRGIQPVEVGSRSPNWKATDLKTGKPVSFAEKYRGKVVLVNLWGTLCIPCRKEMPAMDQLYRELGPKGFVIAAVSVDQGDPQVVLDFAKEYQLTFDILHDADGTVQQAFQTVMFPESFLL